MDIITAIQSPTQPIYPPAATHLLIRTGSLGVPPSYYWQLQKRTPQPDLPAQGTPGQPGYTPAQPQPDIVLPLTDGNVSMTMNQWDNWKNDMTDEEYISRKITNNLGLTRV